MLTKLDRQCMNEESKNSTKMELEKTTPTLSKKVGLAELFSQFGDNPFYYTLREHTIENGSKECYSWVGSNGEVKKKFTYMEIFEKVAELSWYFNQKLGIKAGDKVVLCYPPGYDFVIAFIACLISGIIAVPVYPPDPMRGKNEIQRFCDIKQVSEAKIALTVTSYMKSVEIAKTMSSDPRFKATRFEATDNIKFGKDNDQTRADIQKLVDDHLKPNPGSCEFFGVKVSPNTVAFLQFTSGSTSQPKGVIVTHGNLLYNIHLCIASYSFPSILEDHFSEDPDEIPPGLITIKKSYLTEDELKFFKAEFGECRGIMSLNDLRYDKLYIYMKIINKCLYFRTKSFASVFSWLPVYHDMGLIGFVSTPLFFGCNIFQMSPIDFIKKPYLWLHCMDKYHCSVSGAPNFAFEVVSRKITKEALDQLNLKHVFAILSGAEPIRKATISRFINTFKVVGICNNVIKPAYGLAEHTLIVSGNKSYNQKMNSITVDSKKLREKNTVEIVDITEEIQIQKVGNENEKNQNETSFVSSGIVYDGIDLRIINPDNSREVMPGNVGEIWISSESVTLGYYNNVEETERTYNLKFETIDGKISESKYLRTGDSGFILNGMLYISGRIKDLIIIRGRNFYPQDIEEIIDGVSGIRQGSVAAFSVTHPDGEEAIGIAAEIRMETSILGRVRRFFEKPAYENIVKAISKAVFIAHGLPVHYIWLLSPRTILKTSSGKIRRSQTRDAIFSKKLIPLFEWVCEQSLTSNLLLEKSSQLISPTSVITSKSEVHKNSKFSEQNKPKLSLASENTNENIVVDEIKTKIIDFAAQVLGISQKNLDLNAPLHEYGIDSMGAIRLSEMMNEEFGVELDSTLLFNYPTVLEIVDFVAAQISGKEIRKKNLTNNSRIGISSDIVVVGMSCSFPGSSTTPNQFWSMLQSGVDAIEEIPKSRWNIDEFYSKDLDSEGTMYTREGGFIENIDQFGASFFKIAPIEARSMDPQQRLFLEKSYEALDDAGYTLESLKKLNISVFAGCCSNDWTHICKTEMGSNVGTYAATSHAASILANRVSYTLGLTGSSVTVDSACSASIVALHVSLQELFNGQCIAAVVGGINLILSPQITIALCKARMLSMDCRCKSFDASANGYVRGEGVGVLILKTMEDANRDNNKIYSIIKGSSVNHNGRSASLTAPNGISQQNVINSALECAGLRPNDISYLEAHGTGTSLGDPIEISALKNIFSKTRDSGKPLIIGAVKTNIGHLEGAAGIAGIFKVILSLLNDNVPPNLHFKVINPHINLKGFPVIIPVSNTCLQSYDGSKICAGVSAFGFGGTNAHAIFEKPSIDHKKIKNTSKSEDKVLKLNPIAFIFGFHGFQHVNMGKYFFETEEVYREWFLKCCEILDPLLELSLKSLIYPEILDPEILRESNTILEKTEIAQCALFTVQFSMAKLLESKGIHPGLVIGLCDGELVASVYSGSISLESGLKVCMLRGALLNEFSIKEGSMGIFNVSREDAEMAIADMGPQYGNDISIFSSLGPNNVILSGPIEKLETALLVLKEYHPRKSIHSINAKFLRSNFAFGTSLLNNLIEPISNLMGEISICSPTIPIISGSTGNVVFEEIKSPNYWGWQLNNSICISRVLKTAQSRGITTFIDLTPISKSEFGISGIYKPKELDNPQSYFDNEFITELAYYSVFEDTNTENFEPNKYKGMINKTIDRIKNSVSTLSDLLPLNNKKKIQPQESFPWTSFKHSILGTPKIIDGSTKIISSLTEKAYRLFSDHRVHDNIVIPGAGLIDLAAAAIASSMYEQTSQEYNYHQESIIKLKDVIFERPVFICDNHAISEYNEIIKRLKSDNYSRKNKINIACNIEQDGNLSMQYNSFNPDDDTLEHEDNENFGSDCFSCKGAVVEESFILSETLDQLKENCTIREDVKILYDELSEIGLKYGRRFRVLGELYKNETSSVALGAIYLPDICNIGTFESGFYIHPAILDGAFHIASSLIKYNIKKKIAMVPVRIEEIKIKYIPGDQLIWGGVYLNEVNDSSASVNLILFDSEGNCIGQLDKILLNRFDNEKLAKINGIKNEIYWRSEWIENNSYKFSSEYNTQWAKGRNLALIHSGSSIVEEFKKSSILNLNLNFINLEEVVKFDLNELENLFDIKSTDSIVFLSPIEEIFLEEHNIMKSSVDILEAMIKICKLYLKMIKNSQLIQKNDDIPNFWIITGNSQNLMSYSSLSENAIPNNSGLWGLSRSATVELGSLIGSTNQPIKCVDFEINDKSNESLRLTVQNFVNWMMNYEYLALNTDNKEFKQEREFSISSNSIYVNRLQKIEQSVFGPIELFISQRGSISNLLIIPASGPKTIKNPLHNEVLIRVKSIGLNFRDVLNVMGLYPGDPGPPGSDCSGTVVAVGEGVKDFKVGDNVFGIAPGCLKTFVTT
ncbi:Type I fatty acid synthase, partial [Cryptosporidium felis]